MHASDLTGQPATTRGGGAVSRGLARIGRVYLAGWSWYVRAGLTPPGSRELPCRGRAP